MKIKNAIIIHGPGRSGTTLLYEILALHPDLYWISSYVNKYPNLLFLSILNNIHSFDLVEKLTRNKKKIPRPTEAYNFWNYYIKSFKKSSFPLSPNEKGRLKKAVHTLETFQEGSRLITKVTGPSLSHFIEDIFEDPTIIWIDRDPKAIISSYYLNKWRYKDKPDVFKEKTGIELIEEYATYYNNLQSEKENLKRFKFKRVTYESLVEDPDQFFNDLCLFLNLEFSENFQKLIKSWEIKTDTNEKYKTVFNIEEQQYLKLLF